MQAVEVMWPLPHMLGLVALAVGARLKRSEWLEKQRCPFPVLGLIICHSGFALFGMLPILLVLSILLLAGLLASNVTLAESGSVLLWLSSASFNMPLALLVDPHPGLGWTLLGLLIALAGFFFTLAPFAWSSWGRRLRQWHSQGTTNCNES